MNDIIKQVTIGGLTEQFAIAKSLGQEDEFCKSHNIDIEKGGKAATIGEIREFGGKKYQKQANGWRPVKKGDQKSQNYLSPAQETAVSKLKEQYNEDYEVKHLGSGTHEISFNGGKKHILNREGEEHSEKKEVEHKSDLKEGEEVRTAGGKMQRVVSITGNLVRVSGESDPIHISKLYRPNGEAVVSEKKSSTGTHIGDMSKEQKYAAAAKFGIQNPEKLSAKELDKQLIDKNIEAQLKKFKENKK